jgi:hypothetical protein
VRAIFFDPDAADAAVERLRRDGYEAAVERERLAGEDDDEDHPWAVVSDAPSFVLEVVCDDLDGWFDAEEEQPVAPPPPLVLPTAPKRIKRPQQ